MFKFFLIGFLFVGTAQAQRQSLNPELFWQPSFAHAAATLSYLYENNDGTDTVAGIAETFKGEGKGVRLDLEYGVLSFLSLGAAFSYQNLRTTTTQAGVSAVEKREGPDDWEFVLKMVVPSDRTRLYLGTRYRLSSENNQEKTGLSRFNRAAGGNALAPYFGVQFPMGPLWVGLKGQWTLFDDRTLEVDGVETTLLSGGDELDVVANFEYNSGLFVFGLGAGVFLKQKEDSTVIASSVTTSTQSSEKTHALIYTKLALWRWLEVLLQADYFYTVEQEISTTLTREEAKEIQGRASLRFSY